MRAFWKRATAVSTKTHDYRTHVRGWGHDLVFTPRDGGLKAKIMGWGQGIQKGDAILMSNPDAPSGEAVYRVLQVEYYRDPPDMWTLEAVFEPRNRSPKK